MYDQRNFEATANRSLGFTVLELVLVISILTLIAATATPSLISIRESYTRERAEFQIASDIRLAQSLAAAQDGRAVITILPGGGRYTYGLDFAPYNTPMTHDSIEFSRELESGVTVSGVNLIVFNSRGLLIDSNGDITSQSFTLSDDTGVFRNGVLYPLGTIEYN